MIALAVVAAGACAGPCVQPIVTRTDPAVIVMAASRALGRLRNGSDAADPGFALQLAVRDLVVEPSARTVALASLSTGDHPIVSGLVDAGAVLRSMTPPKSALPKWRIVEVPTPEMLRVELDAAARATGVSWSTLAAIMLIETRMGRIRGASDAGALGPMQFLPTTWAAYGRGNIHSYRDSLRAAGRYLRANGAPADLDRALFAYNHDQRYVRAVRTYARLMDANRGSTEGSQGGE